MKWIKKYWKWVTGILLLILVSLSVYKSKFAGDGIRVAVEPIARRTIVETVSANGRVEPLRQVRISSEVSGEIVELRVKEGQSVTAGDLLALINPDILTATVERLDAALNSSRANESNARARELQASTREKQALADLKRADQLYKSNALSAQEFEQVKLSHEVAVAEFQAAEQNTKAASYAVKSAEATLAEANRNLKRTTIYAPRAGTITKLGVELGERVVGTAQMAGTELLRIADLRAMMVEVEVNESDINRISIGDSVDITIDAFNQRIFPGNVIESAYTALEKSQTTEQVTSFKVKVLIDTTSYTDLLTRGQVSPFRPGMSASVEIKTRKKLDVITAPIQSVVLRPDSGFTGIGLERFDREKLKECIFIEMNGVAKRVRVYTGIQDDRFIEILKSDSLIGWQVVKAPYAELTGKIKDGDVLKVVDEKELFKVDKD